MKDERRKRLKERFIDRGFEGFSDGEILEFLLAFVLKGRDLGAAGKELLKRYKNLKGIMDTPMEELKEIKGIGEKGAILLKAVKDAASAYQKERIIGRAVVNSSVEVIKYLNLTLSGETVEKFLAIYLNARNEVLSVEALHEGTISYTMVSTRKAIEKAFKHNARAVIFVHNHPGGDPAPSSSDKNLIKMLDRAAHAVDLIVHDHIIIGMERHWSARDNGWLPGGSNKFPVAAEP